MAFGFLKLGFSKGDEMKLKKKMMTMLMISTMGARGELSCQRDLLPFF